MVQESWKPVEVGSLSHSLQGCSTIPGGWPWDFFCQQYLGIVTSLTLSKQMASAKFFFAHKSGQVSSRLTCWLVTRYNLHPSKGPVNNIGNFPQIKDAIRRHFLQNSSRFFCSPQDLQTSVRSAVREKTTKNEDLEGGVDV